tara:strand:+ start:5631 stop:6086 length:456 start_codon:yes stop_codon:yes gene_type:complete
MSTHASVIGTNGDYILPNSGVIDFVGKTTNDPCFIRNARLLPLTILNTSSVISLNLQNNNNFHIDTHASINMISLTNIIKGQSGHIFIHNETEIDSPQSPFTLKVDDNTGYIKWQGGQSPILSTTIGYSDILSYYVYSTTCVLMIASPAYY